MGFRCDLWMEQCEAAVGIRERHGAGSAFDYLVGEKLLNFAEAAAADPRLAAELPRFVAEARCLFTTEEIGSLLARLERQLADEADLVGDPEDEFAERPEAYHTRVAIFQRIAEFMKAPALGTS